MEYTLTKSWYDFLSNEFEESYYKKLKQFVENEYQNHTCYPNPEQIFAAFNACPLEKLKVVIMGQDPYHGFGQADGLCFSVNDGVTFPPSLINIFKELQSDLGIPIPISGNLERWANQGILLLNATLTVRQNQAGSHQKKGWETFTDAVIQKIAAQKKGIVFLLWGAYAQKKVHTIDLSNQYVLTSGHPSPLSANRGLWFGNKHFSKTNTYLENSGNSKINW